MKIYYADQVEVPHATFLALRQAGKIRLGMDNDVAVKVSHSNLIPKSSSAGKAFHFWSIAAMLLFLGSIYLSFTWAWWSFIAGLVIALLLHSANKTSNVQNLLDLATDDPLFYEQMRGLKLWQYQMAEEDAGPLLRTPAAVA